MFNPVRLGGRRATVSGRVKIRYPKGEKMSRGGVEMCYSPSFSLLALDSAASRKLIADSSALFFALNASSSTRLIVFQAASMSPAAISDFALSKNAKDCFNMPRIMSAVRSWRSRSLCCSILYSGSSASIGGGISPIFFYIFNNKGQNEYQW